MCEMCADHSVKNRDGYITAMSVDQWREQPTAMPSPAIGHNNPPASDEDLIAENFKLEDLNKAAMLKLKDWKAPNDARIKEIENELLRRLQERKADSTRTDSGTAYISNPMDHKVEDPAKFFDWVAENWDDIAADVKLGISVAAVRAFMERNNGAPPPGVKVGYYTSLNIRRS